MKEDSVDGIFETLK
jgi:ribonucleoside-diphosphate reductase alpha chain